MDRPKCRYNIRTCATAGRVISAVRRNRVFASAVTAPGLITAYLVALSLCVAGCSHSFDASGKMGVVRPIRGRIKIIEVEPWMNSALVRFDGRRCMAWWDNYSGFYAGGHLLHQLPDVAGTSYHFDGLLTDRDIYLGQVWAGKSPPQFNGIPGKHVRYGLQKKHLPDQTIMSATPVGGGLKLPTTKPSYTVPQKQHKIPLPVQLGS